MKDYCRVMLGRKSNPAEECFAGSFIGADFGIHQDVRGVIIALEDDQRIPRALALVPSIVFYRYQVSFKLTKS